MAAGQGEDVERVGDFLAGDGALAGNVVGVEVLVGLSFALLRRNCRYFRVLSSTDLFTEKPACWASCRKWAA